jgi:hypothetical protein
MESPRYLIGQAAAQHGVSANQAKRALYLQGLSADARCVKDAAKALGVSTDTIKTIARRYMIDFIDYRPYASLEKKGQPRPCPKIIDIHRPASALPIFAEA